MRQKRNYMQQKYYTKIQFVEELRRVVTKIVQSGKILGGSWVRFCEAADATCLLLPPH